MQNVHTYMQIIHINFVFNIFKSVKKNLIIVNENVNGIKWGNEWNKKYVSIAFEFSKKKTISIKNCI